MILKGIWQNLINKQTENLKPKRRVEANSRMALEADHRAEKNCPAHRNKMVQGAYANPSSKTVTQLYTRETVPQLTDEQPHFSAAELAMKTENDWWQSMEYWKECYRGWCKYATSKLSSINGTTDVKLKVTFNELALLWKWKHRVITTAAQTSIVMRQSTTLVDTGAADNQGNNTYLQLKWRVRSNKYRRWSSEQCQNRRYQQLESPHLSFRKSSDKSISILA